LWHLVRNFGDGSEVVPIFTGALAELQDVAFAMIRLLKPTRLPEIMRVPLPVRIVVVIIGPPHAHIDYHEIGRAMGTMMANSVCCVL
jgi:hypothetical protein